MNTRDESAASDVSEQTEQVQPGSEQSKNSTAEPSFADALLRTAIEDGHVIGPQPKADAEDKAEPEEIKPAETETVPKAEPEVEVEAEPEAKPEAKKGEKLVPLAEVLEERAKKNRARERAEKAEALVAQFQAQLAHSVAPQPTEDNPFIDVQDINKLDSLERSYEKTIDLADENPDGAVDVVIGRDKDGREIRKDFSPEELVAFAEKS
jgi:membrane protein involved in colicin uptake